MQCSSPAHLPPKKTPKYTNVFNIAFAGNVHVDKAGTISCAIVQCSVLLLGPISKRVFSAVFLKVLVQVGIVNGVILRCLIGDGCQGHCRKGL